MVCKYTLTKNSPECFNNKVMFDLGSGRLLPGGGGLENFYPWSDCGVPALILTIIWLADTPVNTRLGVLQMPYTGLIVVRVCLCLLWSQISSLNVTHFYKWCHSLLVIDDYWLVCSAPDMKNLVRVHSVQIEHDSCIPKQCSTCYSVEDCTICIYTQINCKEGWWVTRKNAENALKSPRNEWNHHTDMITETNRHYKEIDLLSFWPLIKNS